VKVNHFGGTCHSLLQGQRISQARNKHEAGNKQNFAITKLINIKFILITAEATSIMITDFIETITCSDLTGHYQEEY
jgi:hypothetical protein